MARSIVRATHCKSVIDPSRKFFRFCRTLDFPFRISSHDSSSYIAARTRYEPRSTAMNRLYSCICAKRKLMKYKKLTKNREINSPPFSLYEHTEIIKNARISSNIHNFLFYRLRIAPKIAKRKGICYSRAS